MYRKRPFDLVTVTVNYPDEEKAVRKFLETQHAASRNYISTTMDPHELVRAFDPEWDGGVPYSMVIAPGGKVRSRIRGPGRPFGSGRSTTTRSRSLCAMVTSSSP